MDADLDAVVIGGGIQGLLALETLHARGYAAALVTDRALGAGQTLHSHGFLNTGFGMVGDTLLRTSEDVVQPYLRRHGVAPSGEWRVIPPPGFPMAAVPAALPDGFEGPFAVAATRSPDRNVPKRQLVAAVSRPLLDRVIRGSARVERESPQPRRVTVRTPSGDALELAARVVVVAAGCGTKRIVEELVGRTAQTGEIQHRRVHIICVRAPRGALPAMSVVDMPSQLMLVAHEDGDTVTWYVTPMEFGGPAYDDVPTDAESQVDAETVARGFDALRRLFPRLADVAGVRVGAYAGYRQDVGDMPAQPLCEPLEGAEDVVVALPSGLVAPWINSVRIADLVAARVTPSTMCTPLPRAGVGVDVGATVEDRQGFVWRTADEFARSLGG